MKYRLILRQTYVGTAYWEPDWRRKVPRVQRRHTLLVYERPNSINYTASCTIVVCGRRGWIDTLNGRNFYAVMQQLGIGLFLRLGLRTVEVDVKDSHLRLVAQSLGHLVEVRRLRSSQVDGITLNRIEIRAWRTACWHPQEGGSPEAT